MNVYPHTCDRTYPIFEETGIDCVGNERLEGKKHPSPYSQSASAWYEKDGFRS